MLCVPHAVQSPLPPIPSTLESVVAYGECVCVCVCMWGEGGCIRDGWVYNNVPFQHPAHFKLLQTLPPFPTVLGDISLTLALPLLDCLPYLPVSKYTWWLLYQRYDVYSMCSLCLYIATGDFCQACFHGDAVCQPWCRSGLWVCHVPYYSSERGKATWCSWTEGLWCGEFMGGCF